MVGCPIPVCLCASFWLPNVGTLNQSCAQCVTKTQQTHHLSCVGQDNFSLQIPQTPFALACWSKLCAKKIPTRVLCSVTPVSEMAWPNIVIDILMWINNLREDATKKTTVCDACECVMGVPLRSIIHPCCHIDQTCHGAQTTKGQTVDFVRKANNKAHNFLVKDYFFQDWEIKLVTNFKFLLLLIYLLFLQTPCMSQQVIIHSWHFTLCANKYFRA